MKSIATLKCVSNNFAKGYMNAQGRFLLFVPDVDVEDRLVVLTGI